MRIPTTEQTNESKFLTLIKQTVPRERQSRRRMTFSLLKMPRNSNLKTRLFTPKINQLDGQNYLIGLLYLDLIRSFWTFFAMTVFR